MESKQFVATLPMAVRSERFISLKCNSCLCVGAHLSLPSKGTKSLKITCFKGIGQNDESENKANGSKSLKKPVTLSYVLYKSKETLTDSSKVQNDPTSSTFEAHNTVTGSQAIEILFKNWLTLLRTPSPNLVIDETIEGESSRAISETQNGTKNNEEHRQILRTVCSYFLGLDAAIKAPAMIFIPLSLGVNVIYGAEVSKELTPLWILGPLFITLYIKAFRGLCALYFFSFKNTVKVANILPIKFRYIAGGTLFRSVLEDKNEGFKEVSERLLKVIGVWLEEVFWDLVDICWPLYRKTVAAFKNANLT